MNYYFLKNSTDSRINCVQIKVASPQLIMKWGSRKLPNGDIVGEIKTSQTMNYKTLKPENTGLFCERIFGPIHDFQCACGKNYQNELVGFCTQCKIEFISSQVRRHRLGYIKLLSPVVHIWYIKYIAILLDLSLKSIDSLVYCTDELIIKKFYKNTTNNYKNFILTVNFINNIFPSNFLQVNYSLYIQKNLLTYINNSKKALFFIKKSQKRKKKHTFESFYYLINSFYSISYCFQWEARRQWNLIAWFLRLKKKTQENPFQITIFMKNQMPQMSKKYEEKLFFGTKVIYNWLKFFDYNFQLPNLERQIRFYLFEIKEEIRELSGILSTNFIKIESFISFQKKIKKLHWQRNKVFRRLKLITYFRQAKIQPRWMILSVLPVLPPDLRPIVELGSNKVAVSDLNKSYQTILLRNIRLNKFYNSTSLNDLTEEIRYTKRLLQESVDELIQQNKTKRVDSKVSKSLSDILKGKKGRFRQNLLGKRVDYSGRSVIIVDPKLKLHECGIPLKMIIELFYPFIIQHLLYYQFANTIPKAKKMINNFDQSILTSIYFILNNHLILLNRAPTLHKLGIQAFQPKLVPGRAIRLHPLVCPAFNADFDGDQMGVHIPLSFEARAESWKLLWSRNNLLFSSTGTPVLTPGQDMILGCYYLTSEIDNILNQFSLKFKSLNSNNTKNLYFKNVDDVLKAYNQEKIAIHSEIWLKWEFDLIHEKNSKYPDEIQIYNNGYFCFNYSNFKFMYNIQGFKISQFLKTTVGRILFNSFIETTSI